jgi:hypothetical protein
MVRLGWATSDAGANTDFVPPSRTVTFLPGETVKTVTLPIVRDDVAEGEEHVVVFVHEAAGAWTDQGGDVHTIVDDDHGVTPAGVSVSDVHVVEGDSGAQTAFFTVALPRPQATDVTVKYRTVARTAAAPGDYTAKDASARIKAGQTTVDIAIPLIADTNAEGTEHFDLVLRRASGATIVDGTGMAIVVDDD